MKKPSRQTKLKIRRFAALTGVVIIIAVLAQIAGVSGKRGIVKVVQGTSVATVANSPVPDVISTKLASTKIYAKSGETVRMKSTAQLRADYLPKDTERGQGVCGLTYTRDADAAWTLGIPYETMLLKLDKTEKVHIDRSFIAPADDTYRVEVRCHVSAPDTGAKVRGNAIVSMKLGLPDGAATPIKAIKVKPRAR